MSEVTMDCDKCQEFQYLKGKRDGIKQYKKLLNDRCTEHLNKYGKSKGIGRDALFNIIDNVAKEIK